MRSSVASTTVPDWNRVAASAEVTNGELARLLIQMVLAMAMQCASDGNQVTLNFKVGKLTLSSDGSVSFESVNTSNNR